MIERDPNIVQSSLARTVKRDGVTVEVPSSASSAKPNGRLRWSIARVRPLFGTTSLQATKMPTPNSSEQSRRKGCRRSSTQET
jgi:hypothetical protein